MGEQQRKQAAGYEFSPEATADSANYFTVVVRYILQSNGEKLLISN